jgi:hypothetical protein
MRKIGRIVIQFACSLRVLNSSMEADMLIPQVLEVALGMALLYYLLGLVVSWICKIVMETFETRGRALEEYLKRIVGNKSLGPLISMPQIRSLAPVRYQSWLGVFSSDVKMVEKKVEKIPVTNLVDAFFDLTQLDIAASGEELVNTINKLPPSEGKTELLRMINSGVTQSADLRAKMTQWFEGLMDQAAAKYKAYARQFVILFSLFITVFFGVDSIDLFKQLWANPDLRAIAAVKAQTYIEKNGYDADTTTLMADLEDLNIKIGWSSLVKNMPAPGQVLDFLKFWVLKALGLLITTVAVSQGSSFWYDVLHKLTEAKSPGSNASKSGSEDSTPSSTAPEAPIAYG